jgi:hypothetical protein
MKMNNVKSFAVENNAHLDSGCYIDRIANVQRMAFYAGGCGPLPELSLGFANQFRTMTAACQRQRQAQHLRLATAKPQLRIDAHDA